MWDRGLAAVPVVLALSTVAGCSRGTPVWGEAPLPDGPTVGFVTEDAYDGHPD
ncbi:MAG: hypothetical protein ACRDT6_04595 [Micromonosporaceae bacterium]